MSCELDSQASSACPPVSIYPGKKTLSVTRCPFMYKESVSLWLDLVNQPVYLSIYQSIYCESMFRKLETMSSVSVL